MKKLILILVLAILATVGKVAAEPGYVFILDRAVFFSQSGTIDSNNGGVTFNDVRGVLVKNKFYISGEMCIHSECMNLFEEYWLGEINGNQIRVSDHWETNLVEIYNDNPLQIIFTTRRGKYAYGFKTAVPAEIDALKWGRQYITNDSITGENFLVLIDRLNNQ